MLSMPMTGYSCEVKNGALSFVDAFLSGDVDKITTFYKNGTPVSIASDYPESMPEQSATTEKGFKTILKKYLEHKMYRKAPKEMEITDSKIIYGGNNYYSYHFHWTLRSINYKCINNEFKISHLFLIDGM